MHIFEKYGYRSIDALNADFPDGEYYVSIRSRHNQFDHQRLELKGKGKNSDYPPAPKVSLHQDGQKVEPGSIDPDRDLVLSWTPFSTGRADPRNILDDIIIVLTDDCRGEVVGSSGLPFTGRYLSFRDRSYTIRAGSLEHGRPYSFRLEHIRNVDTISDGMVAGLAVYAVITIVDVFTIGEAVDDRCST